MIALIKTANKSISRLRNVNSPMILSPEDELAIKNKEICWVCEGKFVEGSGETPVHDHDHLNNSILSGGVTFVNWHINLVSQTLSSNTFYWFTCKILTMI